MGGPSLFTSYLPGTSLGLIQACPQLSTSTHYYIPVLLGFKFYLISSYWIASFIGCIVFQFLSLTNR